MRSPKFLGSLLEMVAFVLLFWLFMVVSERLPKPWDSALMISAIPLAWLGAGVAAFYLDCLEQWVWRKTRDEVWLMTQEGRQWLESEEGKRWSEHRTQ